MEDKSEAEMQLFCCWIYQK